ncbi:MAG: SDR family oxidoreductase [Candidatus Korobacteraceae bacterium]
MSEQPVALVTGSRTGIGRYVAEQLVAAGYQVVGCSRQPADWTLDGYTHFEADVADESQVQALLANIRRQYKRLDVTFNNAGVASMNHSLLMPVATLDRIMSINVRGTFLVSRESAKLMRQKRWGRIVNLSTVAVPLSLEGEAAYVASKSAVEGLTRVMSREFAELGVTVNAIGPGPIETGLIRNVPEAAIQSLLSRLPIHRMCRAEDVFHVLQFLIDRKSDSITGQVIYLGGA